jgi:hypothetical protein
MNHPRISILTVLVLIGCRGATAPSAESHVASWSYFGDSIANTTNRISMQSAADLLSANGEVTGLFEAQIVQSCLNLGCWISVKGGNGDTVMVFMKDHAYFVPTDSLQGKTTYFSGRAFNDTVSVAMQKHILMDAGASQAKIDAITSPSFELGFEATGVMIADVPMGAPMANTSD